MNYQQYQEALAVVLKTYHSTPKTSASVLKYNVDTQELHRQYRAAKSAPSAAELKKQADRVSRAEDQRLEKENRMKDRINKYEDDLIKLSEDVRDYQQGYDQALRTKNMAHLESYEGGEERRAATRQQLERSAVKLKNAKDKLARLRNPRPPYVPTYEEHIS